MAKNRTEYPQNFLILDLFRDIFRHLWKLTALKLILFTRKKTAEISAVFKFYPFFNSFFNLYFFLNIMLAIIKSKATESAAINEV